jgi:hypothetical protein
MSAVLLDVGPRRLPRRLGDLSADLGLGPQRVVTFMLRFCCRKPAMGRSASSPGIDTAELRVDTEHYSWKAETNWGRAR